MERQQWQVAPLVAKIASVSHFRFVFQIKRLSVCVLGRVCKFLVTIRHIANDNQTVLLFVGCLRLPQPKGNVYQWVLIFLISDLDVWQEICNISKLSITVCRVMELRGASHRGALGVCHCSLLSCPCFLNY